MDPLKMDMDFVEQQKPTKMNTNNNNEDCPKNCKKKSNNNLGGMKAKSPKMLFRCEICAADSIYHYYGVQSCEGKFKKRDGNYLEYLHIFRMQTILSANNCQAKGFEMLENTKMQHRNRWAKKLIRLKKYFKNYTKFYLIFSLGNKILKVTKF
jgi:hypothetical protein